MDDVLPDETRPTDRKMEEDGNARDEAKFSYFFQELQRKGDVIAMKVTSRMVNAYRWNILFGMSKRQYMSYSNKRLRFVRFDTSLLAKPERTTRRPQQDYSGHQITR